MTATMPAGSSAPAPASPPTPFVRRVDPRVFSAFVPVLLGIVLDISTTTTAVIDGIRSCTYFDIADVVLGIAAVVIAATVSGSARRPATVRSTGAVGAVAVAAGVALFVQGLGVAAGPCDDGPTTGFLVAVVGAVAVLALLVIASDRKPPGEARSKEEAQPLWGRGHLRDPKDALLRVEDLVVEFHTGPGRTVKAVSGISLDVLPGETLGLVGESGCGKSTTGRAILQLPPPTGGHVYFEGQDLTKLGPAEVREMRRRVQLVFQDPISSLNPRRRVGDIVGEPLKIWDIGSAEEQQAKVDEVLSVVGLDPEIARPKRPHEFSGGQCQRISIARALVLDPTLIICDEPVSALDVSVQAQILNLLEDMKARYGLTLIFIAHDLAVVKNVSDRVAVMYLGKICEIAHPDELYAKPAHPYTAALLSAIPVPDPNVAGGTRIELAGDPPSPIDPPSGCRFRTRCPRATERCADEEPMLRPVLRSAAAGIAERDHFVACHHPLVEAVDESLQPVTTAAAAT